MLWLIGDTTAKSGDAPTATRFALNPPKNHEPTGVPSTRPEAIIVAPAVWYARSRICHSPRFTGAESTKPPPPSKRNTLVIGVVSSVPDGTPTVGPVGSSTTLDPNPT